MKRWAVRLINGGAYPMANGGEVCTMLKDAGLPGDECPRVARLMRQVRHGKKALLAAPCRATNAPLAKRSPIRAPSRENTKPSAANKAEHPYVDSAMRAQGHPAKTRLRLTRRASNWAP